MTESRRDEAQRAYQKAMAVLDDVQVVLSTSGVEVSIEHTKLRLELADHYMTLGNTLSYQAASDEDTL